MWPASQAYRAPPDRFPYRGRLAKRGQFTGFHPLIRRLFLADGADWPRGRDGIRMPVNDLPLSVLQAKYRRGPK